jgi:endo-1,4-beta-D-glucanase Y/4-amino-4-deoxy-L-arabinose transferase-like glycosyltransferase
MSSSLLTRPPAQPPIAAPPELPVQEPTPTGKSMSARARGLRSEPLLLLALVLIGLVSQGFNMFRYPAFTTKDDEGIYAEQAWAVLRQGRLSFYTYFYDHAPAGWIMIAGWMGLTGGPNTFGDAIDSGRVLMLLLHLAMVPLLYRVARKVGCSPAAAALATFLFSVSPLAIFYQRMLLLDTIMLFWALLSLDLLLDGWGRLSRVILSGVCFGLALLSKETAIFLLPALLYIAVQQRWRHQARFGVAGWLLTLAAVTSWYPLFAALKGELLPAGQSFAFFIGDDAPHVTLVDALRWQATRTGGGMFNWNNEFWKLVRTSWLPLDPLLLVGGAVAAVLNLLRGIRDRRALAAGLLGILPLYYLGRGGIVFDYYILFAIPFLCLNLALLLAPLFARLPPRATTILALVLGLTLVAGYWQAGTLQPLYTKQPDRAGREAIAWIKANVPADSLIIGRDDLWTDLHEPGLGGPAFPNYHTHWKVGADPAIYDGVFHNDWQMVDYLVMSPGLQFDFAGEPHKIAEEALSHAHLVKHWDADGSIVELWKVDKVGTTETALLKDSAAYLTSRFERDGAYVAADGTVTSEAQSYALLRAVWSSDRPAFDRSWTWTRAHLLGTNGLPAWQWRDGAVIDANSAADADSDIALALLLGSQRWNDPALREAGAQMVRAIWDHEVATVGGVPYLTAGNWAPEGSVIALNPSYFAPYAYKIFQEVDSDHDWYGVVDSSYRVLFDASAQPLDTGDSAGLPPDWIGLDRATGTLVPLHLDGTNTETTRYGYDAARTYWRIALDLRWNNDGRADVYLRTAGFLRDEVVRKGYVSAVYGHRGAIVEEPASTVGTAGAQAALLTLDPGVAGSLWAGQFVSGATHNDGKAYWGNPADLYTQEWGWFATALYANTLSDLWPKPTAR